MNELVTSRVKAAARSRASRRGIRVLAVEALGPLTVLGGLLFALVVAPGIVDDLESAERRDAPEG